MYPAREWDKTQIWHDLECRENIVCHWTKPPTFPRTCAPHPLTVSGYQELITAFKESNSPCITRVCACAEYKYVLEMHKNTLSIFFFLQHDYFSYGSERKIIQSFKSWENRVYFELFKRAFLPGFDQRDFQHQIWKKVRLNEEPFKILYWEITQPGNITAGSCQTHTDFYTIHSFFLLCYFSFHSMSSAGKERENIVVELKKN